jgi:hypothetical protein
MASAKLDQAVKCLAGFFDNPAEAEKLIREHLDEQSTDTLIRIRGGAKRKLKYFFKEHLEAYRKRVTAKTPHSLSILEGSLEVSYRTRSPV